MTTSTDPDEPREVVGRSGARYRWWPSRRLGGGGFGSVYEAAASDGTALALKWVTLRGPGTDRWYADGRLAERELHLAQKLAQTDGGHVLPVLDEELTDDAFYLLMPRAERSLADRLKRDGPLGEEDARTLLLHAAAGLRQLAEASVVHRDIKPGNLLWWRGRWVLADLGIGRDVSAGTGTYSWAGTGTHEYWAPELFGLDQPASVKSDMYALGCTVFEALTGAPPFPGSDLARAHRNQLPDLPKLSDPALLRVIARLLAKDPATRFADARQVEQALTPAPLGPDQHALQRLSAKTQVRAREGEARVRQAESRQRARSSAKAVFVTIWEDAATRALTAVPEDTEAFAQDPQWFLRVGHARLAVLLAEPADASRALLLGTVSVQLRDGPQRSVVANLICEGRSGDFAWELARFSHNIVSSERPTLEPRGGQGPRALPLTVLDEVLPRLGQTGPPPVVAHRWPLSAQSLLALLVDEEAALDPDE